MASIKRSFSLCILLVVLGVFASFRYYFLMLYLDGGWRILHTVLQHVEIDRQRKIRFNISLTGCGALFIYSGPHLVPLQYSTVVNHCQVSCMLACVLPCMGVACPYKSSKS